MISEDWNQDVRNNDGESQKKSVSSVVSEESLAQVDDAKALDDEEDEDTTEE